ncbi:hypothetical protein chiPu_0003640 [Chiloscyllium punctatum]|uniref:Uncharacterized protein n=1 Tax=Chiloscyllium punctatum TaxID=137246 RepID=A0A401S4C8_CHIPU|nr:hypothetical protein [Chiloscyllium punctatum]
MKNREGVTPLKLSVADSRHLPKATLGLSRVQLQSNLSYPAVVGHVEPGEALSRIRKGSGSLRARPILDRKPGMKRTSRLEPSHGNPDQGRPSPGKSGAATKPALWQPI